MKVMTLAFPLLIEDGGLILGYKKRGFGEGLFNGFGGSVEEGETVVEAAIRELREEANIQAAECCECAILDFHFEGGEPPPMRVHAFLVPHWEAGVGGVQESDEMQPRAFRQSELPYDKMWPDDRVWLPEVLDGRSVRGIFHFHTPEKLKGFHVIVETDQTPSQLFERCTMGNWAIKGKK